MDVLEAIDQSVLDLTTTNEYRRIKDEDTLTGNICDPSGSIAMYLFTRNHPSTFTRARIRTREGASPESVYVVGHGLRRCGPELKPAIWAAPGWSQLSGKGLASLLKPYFLFEIEEFNLIRG